MIAAVSSSRALLPPIVRALLQEIEEAEKSPDLDDNVDFGRFPEGMPETTSGEAAARLAELLAYADGLQLLYERLEEPADRQLLVRVLAFRVLGHRRVRLPMTATRLHALTERAHSMRVAEGTAPFGIFDWLTDDYDLAELGIPLRVRTVAAGVVQNFLLDQYRCEGVVEIAVRPGDVVVDGGAFAGDTSLYFAHLAGPGGRVHAFEFEPANLALLDQNLGLNPALAARIDIRRAALWDEHGELVSFTSFGPGTAITVDGEGSARTETIDSLVERGEIARVDFVKLDIEGSELQALRGAEATLRRFRPRLAIAAYHRPADLSVLPAFLAGLDVGYRFRLGHGTMHHEETVLFARTVESDAVR